jgi:2-dehydro-3-deoxyglucarate aldolase
LTSEEIRDRLKSGPAVIGTWLQLPGPDTAEIIGRSGYAWAAADLEHGAITRGDLPGLFRALELGGTAPFARLLRADRERIKEALDSGARGLIFPMIESRAQLDEAIAQSLYPGGSHFGRRGVGFARANGYGRDLAEHLAPENGLGRNIVLVAQIEHVKALDEIEAIFSHPRLDAYMVGPYDLSASLGRPGDFSHSEFLSILKRLEEAAEARGLARGFHQVEPDPAALKARMAEGYRFLAYGTDALFLARAVLNPLPEARP